MKNYRNAFWLALGCNLALAAVLAAFWLRSHPALVASLMKANSGGSVIASPPATSPVMEPEQSLAEIPLSSPRMQGIPLSFAKVERKAVLDEIRTTGNIALDESRLAYVQLRFSGSIRKVFINATYQYAQEGTPLFTIYSPDVVATEREYLVALQNQQRLLDSTVPGVTANADALPTAALDRLRQMGVPSAEIERLQNTAQVREEIEIPSPVSGHVIEREAVPNKFIEPNTRLYTVADLSNVWVIAQVQQSDLGQMRKGEGALVTVDAYPGNPFNGTVDFIYPDVDMTTRTTRVRLVLANPNLALTPGMFANVAFQVAMGQQLMIPASGILQTGTRSIVFVDDGKGYLRPRDVETGPRFGDDIVITKGLRGGERVVTSANFLIDSESQLQSALRSFTPPAQGQGNTAGASTEASLDFSTEPNPPHKGKNSFRVQLRDSKGTPLTGADVTVGFFMAAMPAMGMAEMKSETRLRDMGNGNYEGSSSLDSGGTWQVTITARRNGQTISTKQLSVNAIGGM